MNIFNLSRYEDTFRLCTDSIIEDNPTHEIRELYFQLIKATNTTPVTTRLVTWDSNYLQVTFEGDLDCVNIVRIDGILVGYYKALFVNATRHKLIDILVAERASDEAVVNDIPNKE